MPVPSDATEEVIENQSEYTGELIGASQWVVVHEAATGNEYRLNVDHIVGVRATNDGGALVYLSTRTELRVTCTLDDITGALDG